MKRSEPAPPSIVGTVQRMVGVPWTPGRVPARQPE